LLFARFDCRANPVIRYSIVVHGWWLFNAASRIAAKAVLNNIHARESEY